ncbi:DUF1972 domain-containing protein [Butyricimonas sp. Marseille-P3923]|uniref:DUF1972 domain-containing protein n=1 Tax=Butyricimonas sp. Marseille-P3923 TaxID=1987504 RepID=UPI000C07D53F|nr:DUF1972 domain-containing protein [Butyricimonas sp. Marseille-P3923]
MTKIAIIGSHGLYANYGGWDQLVRNLAERKSDNVKYLIFNSADTAKNIKIPDNVEVRWLVFKASGFQGLFYDFWSILSCFRKVDVLLLLGDQGIPLIPLLNLVKRNVIVSNVGGIEWERPKFGYFAKMYLKWCFKLAFKYSKYVILDNEHYKKFIPKSAFKANVKVIPYGGEIDQSITVNGEMIQKYPFLDKEYFLSISRSLRDNNLTELCESFVGSQHQLVLISNFSKSTYGIEVFEKYKNENNIILINGLYNKAELDLVRRKCKAYIHTHTLCGTAPSLVEMIISRRPIISIDCPQNRYTLHEQALFFSSFSELQNLIDSNKDLTAFIPSDSICQLYDWNKIVTDYEALF